MGWWRDRIRRVLDGPRHYHEVREDIYAPIVRRSYYLDGWKLSNVEKQEKLLTKMIEVMEETRDEAQMGTEVTASKAILDGLYREWSMLVETETRVDAEVHVD